MHSYCRLNCKDKFDCDNTASPSHNNPELVPYYFELDIVMRCRRTDLAIDRTQVAGVFQQAHPASHRKNLHTAVAKG